MSLTIIGIVVDENGNGLAGLLVEARGDWLLTSEVIDSATTRNGGGFTLVLPGAPGQPTHPSSCRVRVVDALGRPISDDREVPGTDGNQDLGRITVRAADRTGLLVTNGKGEARMVSEGNAMALLIDGEEAFGQVATDIEAATTSIDMTQLFFSVPKESRPDPADEHPELVFAFGPPPLPPPPPVPLPPPPAPAGPPRPDDKRPELLILKAVKNGRAVRILLNKPVVSWPEGVFLLAALPAAAGGLGAGLAALVGLVIGVGLPLLWIALGAALVAGGLGAPQVWKVLDKSSDSEELREYLEAGAARISQPRGELQVRGFGQPAPDNGVLHTKMVIVDGQRATVLGSPFQQYYFSDHRHQIDDPHRGDSTGGLFHDVSVGLVGPVVADLHETFRTYWNEDQTPGNQLPSLPPDQVAPPQPSGPDGVVTAQVVRTLSAGRFSGLDGTSEKGILEGYLRAFGAARRYIYLENQYFTDAIIAEALATVLAANDELELIFMVNIKPDVPLYPWRQGRLLRSVRAAAPGRVGVFTRWSYDPGHPRPWVAPVYLHSKLGVIDDIWATIGSANLDGLSLDRNVVLSPIVFGETTAAELNVNVHGGAPGTSGMAPAERIRRRLWAEHLGLLGGDEKPDPTSGLLAMAPTTKWLPLWRQSAKASLGHLKAASPTELPGFVLEYPEDDAPTSPRRHLAALDIPLSKDSARIRPIGATRPFDFFTGRWGPPNREDFVGRAEMGSSQ
jgi:phosphatidylserine/phosphatidylglycerophosphate/cardiolipin synthase-like enzyme